MPKVNVQIKKKNINLSLVGRRGIRGQKGNKGDQGDPATNLVQSVNGKQGVIVLNYNDVGADQSGSATTALNSAKTYADSKVQDLDNELATVSKTGSYDDLTDKPIIPTVPVLSVNGRTGNVTGLAEESDLTAHISDTNNPHNVTKVQIGLSNVPNVDTTDAVANEHTHSNKAVLDATTASYTTAEKTKLSGIATSATANDTDTNLKIS